MKFIYVQISNQKALIIRLILKDIKHYQLLITEKKKQIMKWVGKKINEVRNLQLTAYILFPILIINFLCCENPNQAEEKNSLIEYARIYSGTESTRDWDDTYWDIIGEFDNVNSYNESRRLNREIENLIKSEKDYWNWSEYSHKIEYQKRRRELKSVK